MARPQKQGLDYYPQDTDIHADRKIRRLITEFGATGYLVYDYIKCLCYSEGGYYLPYEDGLAFDIADFLKAGITENLVNEIIKGCFRMSLFSKAVFDASGIITSAGIQRRYLKIKKTGIIMAAYNIIAGETPVTATITPGNTPITPQIKENEKEIKLKEKKEAFKAAILRYEGKYPETLLLDFMHYWAEANAAGKLRYELEHTWELQIRLRNWAAKEEKYATKWH